MVTQNSKQKKTIDIYGNEGQISYANLRYFNVVGYNSAAKYVQKNETLNLIPSVMEVPREKETNYWFLEMISKP